MQTVSSVVRLLRAHCSLDFLSSLDLELLTEVTMDLLLVYPYTGLL